MKSILPLVLCLSGTGIAINFSEIKDGDLCGPLTQIIINDRGVRDMYLGVDKVDASRLDESFKKANFVMEEAPCGYMLTQDFIVEYVEPLKAWRYRHTVIVMPREINPETEAYNAYFRGGLIYGASEYAIKEQVINAVKVTYSYIIADWINSRKTATKTK